MPRIYFGLTVLILLILWPGCTSAPTAPVIDEAKPVVLRQVSINLEQEAEIPASITYHKSSESVIRAAALKLKQMLTGELDTTYYDFDENIICGPVLWRSLSTFDLFQKAKGIEMNIANINMQQKMFMSDPKAGPGLLQYILLSLPKDKPVVIRKPNEEELQIYWGVIPYPIEEPLFIVDDGRHRFLVCMTEELALCYVDEYTGVSLGPQAN